MLSKQLVKYMNLFMPKGAILIITQNWITGKQANDKTYLGNAIW